MLNFKNFVFAAVKHFKEDAGVHANPRSAQMDIKPRREGPWKVQNLKIKAAKHLDISCRKLSCG